MNEITIRAKDVRIGDELFHNMNGKEPPCYWWHSVSSLETRPDGWVIIGVGSWAGWYTHKHPEEAVTVRRAGE